MTTIQQTATIAQSRSAKNLFPPLPIEYADTQLTIYSFCKNKLMRVEGIDNIPPETSIRCEFSTMPFDEKELVVSLNDIDASQSAKDNFLDHELLSNSIRSKGNRNSFVNATSDRTSIRLSRMPDILYLDNKDKQLFGCFELYKDASETMLRALFTNKLEYKDKSCNTVSQSPISNNGRTLQAVIGAPVNADETSFEQRAKMSKKEKRKFNSYVITDTDIQVFNGEKKVKQVIEDRRIRNAIHVDNSWLYTLSD